MTFNITIKNLTDKSERTYPNLDQDKAQSIWDRWSNREGYQVRMEQATTKEDRERALRISQMTRDSIIKSLGL